MTHRDRLVEAVRRLRRERLEDVAARHRAELSLAVDSMIRELEAMGEDAWAVTSPDGAPEFPSADELTGA